MRQELAKLIIRHTSTQGNDTLAKAKAQATIYEVLLQGLSVR